MTEVVLLDVEGTIGPTSFVREVLFPYAAEALPAFFVAHPEDPVVYDAAAAAEAEAPGQDVVGVLLGWIAADRKVPALKALQGRIWERGYRSGDLVAPVFADAAHAMARWASSGTTLAMFSSGSVLAQRLYLEHSDHGDLRSLVTQHFDTTVGDKRRHASYLTIARALHVAPDRVTFFSDTLEELDAAADAGLSTVHVVRTPGAPTGDHPVVDTLPTAGPAAAISARSQ